MFDSILVVCNGNICRSPVGAALLKARLPGHRIQSAGLRAEAMEGQGVSRLARELVNAEGLDVGVHRAQCLQRAWLESADLVLVMSESQRLAIGHMAPEATGKTFLFGRWLEGGGALGMEIPDPYRKSREAYAYVHQLLVRAADEWYYRLI